MRLVYIALGWAAGVVLAANTNARPTMLWLVLALLALAGCWFGRHDIRQRLISVSLLALTLGGLRFSFTPVSSDLAQYNNVGGLTIEGVISAEPDVRDDRIQLRVDAETVTRIGQTFLTSGTVLVQAPHTANVHYGDQISATGVLITPAESDTFSYADYLARGGVFSIMQNAAVEVLSSGHGSPIYSTLLYLKAQAGTFITRGLPEPQAGLLTGMLLGNQNGISPELGDAFGKVGASHVVAISGFNMVVLSGVVMALLKRAKVRERPAAFIGIVMILVYTIFVGANTAVVRATIMSGVVIIGGVIKRKTYVPATLAFVAIMMSLLNPAVLWDVSFQLSFFATLGLTLFAEPLSKGFNRQMAHVFPKRLAEPFSNFLAEPLMVTLAVQITTLPLIVLYFGRLSLVLFAVNLLIIPVQAQLLILGVAATLTAIFAPGIAQVLYWFDMLLLGWTIGVVRLFANLPFADTAFNVDPRLITLYFVILIGGALMQATKPTWAVRLANFVQGRAIASATVLSGAAIIVLTGAIFISRPDGNLHIWLPDVGHSNAVLVETPRGAHILVDGGRFPSRLLTAIGDHLPFTDQKIEVLVITQPDEFDTSALTAVLARYDIGVALINGQPNLSDSYQQLQAALSAHDVVTVRAGYSLDIDDGVRLEVLNPNHQAELGDSLDDNTLVLRLTYGKASFLLTGDLSRDGQLALLEGGEWPQATVLQLPEHGAIRSLSRDFVAAVSPQMIVLQSDPANRNGDPDGDTLALLGDTPVFRTDQGGAIHMWTDGEDLWVEQAKKS
ncbi:MAG: ComEC/Rec2 family competence protein [Chloroflexota bacterium]